LPQTCSKTQSWLVYNNPAKELEERKRGCLDSARGIFDTMGVRDVFSWTSMVNGYAKSGELELARMSFNEMPERNVVSWSAMIAG